MELRKADPAETQSQNELANLDRTGKPFVNLDLNMMSAHRFSPAAESFKICGIESAAELISREGI